MSSIKLDRIPRLWTIHRVVQRYKLQEFLGRKPRPDPRPRGERLRLALEELGPVFIKLGQALSTRPDVIPPDLAIELSKLQDCVPPFPGAEAIELIEASLGKPIGDVFDEFDPVPLASASVAQVHTARLKPTAPNDPGFEVVVKVLRPGIEKTIHDDVQLMYLCAELAEKFSAQARRIRPRAIVEEYEKIVFDELDLMREAGNAAQLRRNWLGSPLIYHPAVFFDYCRQNVLVMERIRGVSIRELDKLRAMGVDFKVLGERGVEIFFRQTFRDNFFHADMHPGNIFVDASNPKDPSYIAVDFGIVGQLSAFDQRYLAENLLAFFNRDYKRVAELHLESEWVPSATTRLEDFEAAIRTVCEPIYQKPISEISFGVFLLRLFQVARRFNYQVQPQLVLLQKTLLNIEGLGRQLYPELDLWKTAKPIMEEWMRGRIGPSRWLSQARKDIPALAESLPVLVQQVVRTLERGGGLDSGMRRSIEELRVEMQAQQKRSSRMLVGATLIISSALLWVAQNLHPMLHEHHRAPIAAVLLAVAGVAVWWSARRK